LLTELTGRTFARFSAVKSITGGNGADEDIGFGDSAVVAEPSCGYFLGRPLFFFSGTGVAAGDAVTNAVYGGGCGGTPP
jgi:hypothetical protein